jgi:hypothetical protein
MRLSDEVRKCSYRGMSPLRHSATSFHYFTCLPVLVHHFFRSSVQFSSGGSSFDEIFWVYCVIIGCVYGKVG